MKNLKELLNESTYKRMKINDEETEKGMTNEEKREFLNAVSEYKKFGESIYRSGNLAEVYESIKGIVETAHKVTLEETGDWFDKVTVGRHMKSMNESFKVFTNTIKEVNTLQQRLESCYDEMGEVLGKYYEIKEGNEFGAERAKAIAKGDDEFEVDGKKFPVKGVDKDDKENAKEFAKESVNELLAIVDKFDEKRQSYGKVYYKDMSKSSDINKAKSELAKLRLNPKRKDLTIVSVGKNSKMYDVMGESVVNEDASMRLKDLLNETFLGGGELPSSKLIKMKQTLAETMADEGDIEINENKYSIIDPKGNQKGIGTKDQANKLQKKLGGSKKGYFVVAAKSALKARRAMEKYQFDFKNPKLQDKMSDLYFESVTEDIIGEGASSEEKRIVMLAVRKISKYRNVPINISVVDVLRAAEELERDIKKGKVKK